MLHSESRNTCLSLQYIQRKELGGTVALQILEPVVLVHAVPPNDWCLFASRAQCTRVCSTASGTHKRFSKAAKVGVEPFFR